jgi:hypothetical protein
MARRYPRRGQPLAPRRLKSILNRPISGVRKRQRFKNLNDLDATAWRVYSPEECVRLGEQIVDATREAIARGLPNRISERRLGLLPRGITLEDLELDVRTVNGLNRAKLSPSSPQWRDMTVARLLDRRGFGARALVDLLTAVEHRIDQAKLGLDEGLTREAKKLLKAAREADVHRDDPRLGSWIADVDGRVSSLLRLANMILTRDRDPADPETMRESVRQLRLQLRRCARLGLEEELLNIVSSVATDPQARMTTLYLGLDGGGGTTLQAVGDQFDLTRERVRQIVHAVKRKLSERHVFAPRLEQALALIESEIPSDVDALGQQLLDEGVTSDLFDVVGIRQAAQLLDREPSFRLDRSGERVLAVPPEARNLGRTIHSEAARAVSRWGVSTVADVASEVSVRSGEKIREEVVRDVLTSDPRFRWLDEEGGWFWLKGLPRNRLLNFMEKILSVADEVDVSELRRGVSRHYRMKGFAPPSRVLLSLCAQLEGYKVEDRIVRDDPPLDWAEVLRDTEETLVRVLFEHGPLLTGRQLEKYCVDAGMNISTFYVYLGYSPIVARYARGVYGLIGAKISPGAAEALVPKRTAARVVEDFGWTSKGRIWVRYRLSENLLKTGVLTVPAAMSPYLQGDVRLLTEDGTDVGRLSVKASSAWGIGTLFRRRGGEVGDYMILVHDLTDKTTTVYMRDQATEVDALLEKLLGEKAVSD